MNWHLHTKIETIYIAVILVISFTNLTKKFNVLNYDFKKIKILNFKFNHFHLPCPLRFFVLVNNWAWKIWRNGIECISLEEAWSSQYLTVYYCLNFPLAWIFLLFCPCGATEGSDEEGHKARKRAQVLYHARYLFFLSLRKIVPTNLETKKQRTAKATHRTAVHRPPARSQCFHWLIKALLLPHGCAAGFSELPDCLLRSHALGKHHIKPT